jgi:hypothetical protein
MLAERFAALDKFLMKVSTLTEVHANVEEMIVLVVLVVSTNVRLVYLLQNLQLVEQQTQIFLG